MKRTALYILVLGAILIQSSTMLHTQNVSAQDAEGVTANVTIETDCNWTGSDLTVADGEICIISSTQSADNVTVAGDSGLGGGTLIIKAGSGNTTFTVNTSVDIQGTLEIGVAGDTNDATFATNAIDFTVQGSGTVETIANTGTNTLNVDGTLFVYGDAILNNSETVITDNLKVGNPTTTTEGGTVNNNSGGDFNVTSTLADSAEVYRGTINNNIGATDFDVDGTLYLESIGGDSNLFQSYSTANIATVSLDTYTLFDVKGGTTNIGDISLNGSGVDVEIDNGATLTVTGDLNIIYGDVLNDGTLNIGTDLNMNNSTIGTIDNNSDIFITGDMFINDYSTITNDDYLSANSIQMDRSTGIRDPSITNNGVMEFSSGMELRKGSSFDNRGTLNVTSNLILGFAAAVTPSEETAQLVNSTSSTATVNITVGDLIMTHDTEVINYANGTINIDPSAVSPNDGQLFMNTSMSSTGTRPEVDNYGAFNVQRIQSGTSGYGGYFTNLGLSTADVVITLDPADGTGLDLRNGSQLFNYSNAELSVNRVGLLGTSLSAEERTWVYNESTVTGAFEVNEKLFALSYSLIQNAGTFNSNDPTQSYDVSGNNNQIINTGTMTLNGPGNFDTDVDVDISSGGILNILGNLSLSQTANMEITDYGEINVTGTLNQTNSSVLGAGYLNPANYGEITVSDTATISSTLNVDGTFDCTDVLTVNSGGTINQGLDSVVTVNGTDPATTVEGTITLDGRINSGDLTINSGGLIESGEGASTNFLIACDDLTLNLGGNINSNAKSTLDRSGTSGGGGSNGGQGIDVGGTPTATRDVVKITTPLYGEQGEFAAGAKSSNGGGGVRILASGNMLINGNITANGETPTSCSSTEGGAGAGGGIYINHDPSSYTATFSGIGNITANGGNGYSGTFPCYPGGGGRININSPLLDDPDDDNSAAPHYQFPTANIQALGGSVNGQAAAGTIYYSGDSNSPNGTVIVDQGGTAPTGNTETLIPGTGSQIEFDRMEARDAAVVTFVNDPAGTYDPAVCYDDDNGSSVTFVNGCDNYSFPDKPDTLFINNDYPGTQEEDLTENGQEPYIGDPVDDLVDRTPVFSVVYRHPEDPTTPANTLQLEIDDNFNFGSPLWTKTVTSVTKEDGDPVLDGDRTQDIVYDGPTLSLNTPYYIRARFNNDGTNYGLWSHRDIGEYYQFEIADELSITASCPTDANMTITDNNGGGNIRNSNGDRYGLGTCNVLVSSTAADWQVLYGKAYGETTFNDGGGNDINEIDNENVTPANVDCRIDTTGDTPEEEYGFNIYSINSLINNSAQTNSDCRRDTGTYPGACGTGAGEGYYNDQDCIFDIADNGAEDTIIDVTGNNVTDIGFDLNVHVNIDGTTALSTYTIGTNLIITTTP